MFTTRFYPDIIQPYTTEWISNWYQIDSNGYDNYEVLNIRVYLTYKDLTDCQFSIIDRQNVEHIATVDNLMHDKEYDILTLSVAKGIVSDAFQTRIIAMSSSVIKILGVDYSVIPRRKAETPSKGKIHATRP